MIAQRGAGVEMRGFSKFLAALARGVGAMAALLFLWTDGQRPAGAAIAITGAPEDIRVEVTGATVEEFLSGLGGKFEVNYRSSVPLDRPVEGVYLGTLSQVLKSALRQYDFVLKREGSSYSILIIDQSKPAGIAAAQSPQPFPRTAQSTYRIGEPQGSHTLSPVTSYMRSHLSMMANVLPTARGQTRNTSAPAVASSSAVPASAVAPGVPPTLGPAPAVSANVLTTADSPSNSLTTPATTPPSSGNQASTAGVSQSTIAALTQKAQTTLTGLTQALARVSGR